MSNGDVQWSHLEGCTTNGLPEMGMVVYGGCMREVLLMVLKTATAQIK